jgi:tetratricopeptide (TPR) repeat protein
MANCGKSKWLLPVLVLMFIGQSCGGVKDRPSPQSPDQAPAKATSAKQHMAAGEYQNAINDYSAEYRSRPQDQALVKEYVKSLEAIKAVADNAFDKEDFASAGKTYDILRKNYSHFNAFVQKLSFDKAHLNTKLSHCRKSLSTQGFQEYRKGNLGGAIVLWQSLLAFDPDNADIKGAVRTAMLQKKNMQESGAGR